jgi:hypothetical protein
MRARPNHLPAEGDPEKTGRVERLKELPQTKVMATRRGRDAAKV